MGKVVGSTARRLTYVDDLCIPSDENILVIDNGCDQSIININSFLVQSFAGIYYNVGGAISTMKSTNLELVNEAFTLVSMPDGGKFIFKINQAFLDKNPQQSEALLQPHQARAFGVIVDDCACRHLAPSGNPGGQCITVNKSTYKMHFDGWKCYLKITKPQPSDLSKYKIIELTPMLEYAPQRRYSRRVPGTRK